MKYYKNKLIYITGGSSGIGLALARRFTELGAYVLLVARNKKRLEAARRDVAGSLGNPTQRVMTLSMDVSDEKDVEQKMKQAVKDFGPPDILVNSAGIIKHAGPFEKMTLEQFDEVVQINLYGVRNVTHALFPELKKRKGQVVILASMSSFMGMYGYTAYGTSKAALYGFADSLRYEMKPLGMGLTVVFPPEVDTPMIYTELDTLPPEGRAMKNLIGLMKPETVARITALGIARKKYILVPGIKTRSLYALHRLSSGRLTRFISDTVIWLVRKGVKFPTKVRRG